jgi:hypothetical protein
VFALAGELDAVALYCDGSALRSGTTGEVCQATLEVGDNAKGLSHGSATPAQRRLAAAVDDSREIDNPTSKQISVDPFSLRDPTPAFELTGIPGK